MTKEQVYAPAEIPGRLTGPLRHWRFEDGAIRRDYRTHGWKGTLMVVNAIGHLCEAAWHHPDLMVTYDCVKVALSSHDANGITDRDLALAAKIEEFIGWRPGASDGPLQGTPDDPKYAYLNYDP